MQEKKIKLCPECRMSSYLVYFGGKRYNYCARHQGLIPAGKSVEDVVE